MTCKSARVEKQQTEKAASLQSSKSLKGMGIAQSQEQKMKISKESSCKGSKRKLSTSAEDSDESQMSSGEGHRESSVDVRYQSLSHVTMILSSLTYSLLTPFLSFLVSH